MQVRQRLDRLMVERGLASSRERAQALILAGRVLVNEQKITKAGSPIAPDAVVRLVGGNLRYVSRGGLKLERALEHWKIPLEGRVCMDIGASTGGFTDCMLQHGASQVIAIDTGYGQIASKLRSDLRVTLLERKNARYLRPEEIARDVTFLALDVSFISATLVLPAAIGAAFGRQNGESVVLVKPQFEAGREFVGKGGIVRDVSAQEASVQKVRETMQSLGGHAIDFIESPLLGAEGNREFLLYARFGNE